MILALAALLLAGGQTLPSSPPGLQFAFYRMAAFRSRAQTLDCGAGEIDRQLETLRVRLAQRFGEKAFAYPTMRPIPRLGGLADDCRVVMSIYQRNLTSFGHDAEAALASAAPGKE